VPPVGYYRPKYQVIDKYQSSAEHGPKEIWDGALVLKSLNIKEKDFIKKTQVCPRIDRSLVDYRNHQVDQFEKIIGSTKAQKLASPKQSIPSQTQQTVTTSDEDKKRTFNATKKSQISELSGA